MALSFEIKSGKAVLSDPSYTIGTWCAAVLENVKNGRWGVYVEREDKHKRNASLLAYNLESLFEYPHLENELWNAPPLPQLAGVDSGQFGFFDFDGYRNDESITPDIKLWDYTEEEPGDKFYSACCNLTLSKDGYGVLPLGVVSSSGWGDGSYELRAIKNSTGEYIGFLVIFMEDEQLNDDEDEWNDTDDEEEDDEDSE